MQNATIVQNGMPHVVIVGGGFGGLQAAVALAQLPVRLTLIDRTNHHLFQPLLYQVATAGLSPADIASPIRHVLKRSKNVEVLMAEVTGLDSVNRRVLMGQDTLGYDYLILATGARHSYLGHDEWEQFAPGLKSINDATSIRQRILRAFEAAELEGDEACKREWLTFILVGAGPTGVEMAGAIAELAHTALKDEFRRITPSSAHILLLEAGPRIMASFPEELAADAQHKLEQMGVEVRTNTRVEQIDANGAVAGDKRIPSRTIIWTAGVKASPAGSWLSAATDRAGRVMVNPDLSVPGRPEIFVIGDTAHVEQEGAQLPGVAPVAMQQGRYVATVIRNRVRGQAVPPPFHYHDKGNLATVGRRFAIVAAGQVKLAGLIAWLMWLTVHIFYLIGFRNRLLVMLQWMWAYFTFDRGVRIINEAPVLSTPQAERSAATPVVGGSSARRDVRPVSDADSPARLVS
jgi:NADH dehydrogenase